jgi:hypothetical protein
MAPLSSTTPPMSALVIQTSRPSTLHLFLMDTPPPGPPILHSPLPFPMSAKSTVIIYPTPRHRSPNPPPPATRLAMTQVWLWACRAITLDTPKIMHICKEPRPSRFNPNQTPSYSQCRRAKRTCLRSRPFTTHGNNNNNNNRTLCPNRNPFKRCLVTRQNSTRTRRSVRVWMAHRDLRLAHRDLKLAVIRGEPLSPPHNTRVTTSAPTRRSSKPGTPLRGNRSWVCLRSSKTHGNSDGRSCPKTQMKCRCACSLGTPCTKEAGYSRYVFFSLPFFSKKILKRESNVFLPFRCSTRPHRVQVIISSFFFSFANGRDLISCFSRYCCRILLPNE